ncbi:hypothetical protein BC829DRAFT_381358, partial [Chytridium lagenaria]
YRKYLESGLPTPSSTSSSRPAFLDMDEAYRYTCAADVMFVGDAAKYIGILEPTTTWEGFSIAFRSCFAQQLDDAKVRAAVESFKWTFQDSHSPTDAWARMNFMNCVLPASSRVNQQTLRQRFVINCEDHTWSSIAKRELYDGKAYDDLTVDFTTVLSVMSTKTNPGTVNTDRLERELQALTARLGDVEVVARRGTPSERPPRRPLVAYLFDESAHQLEFIQDSPSTIPRVAKSIRDRAAIDYAAADAGYLPPSDAEVFALEDTMNEFIRRPAPFMDRVPSTYRDRIRMPNGNFSTRPAGNFQRGWTPAPRDRASSTERLPRRLLRPAPPLRRVLKLLLVLLVRVTLCSWPRINEDMFVCPLHGDHPLNACPNHRQAYTMFSEKWKIPLR